MFSHEWLTLPGFIAHDWVRYRGENTIAELARSVCEQKNIRDGDILIGASLGGIVACEITKIRKIPQLFLIGSAIHGNEVSPLLAALRSLLAITPLTLIKRLAATSSSPLLQMFAGTDVAFMRAMSGAIFEWDGLGAATTKVHRIHGTHDWVIPPPAKVDLVLDGGHLISMTHARRCVEYVSVLYRRRVECRSPRD